MNAIKFEAEDSYPASGSGGKRTVWTGPCPIDLQSHLQLLGAPVLFQGKLRKVVGVETRAKLPPPSRGEPIGLIFEDLGEGE